MNARSRPPPPPPTGTIPVTLPPPAPRPRSLPPVAPHVPGFPHDDTAPTRVKEDTRLPSWSPSSPDIAAHGPAPIPPAPPRRPSPVPPPTAPLLPRSVAPATPVPAFAPMAVPAPAPAPIGALAPAAPAPVPRDDPSWTRLEPTTSSGVRQLDSSVVPTAPSPAQAPASPESFWKKPGLLPGFVAGFVVGGLVVIALVRLLEPEDPTSSVTSIASPASSVASPSGSRTPTVKADDLPPAIFRVQDLPSANHR